VDLAGTAVEAGHGRVVAAAEHRAVAADKAAGANDRRMPAVEVHRGTAPEGEKEAAGAVAVAAAYRMTGSCRTLGLGLDSRSPAEVGERRRTPRWGARSLVVGMAVDST
jgi:hypothetical protein